LLQDDIPFFEGRRGFAVRQRGDGPLASLFGIGATALVYLLGFYGYRNLGDDVMLEQLVAALLSCDSVGHISVDMREETLRLIHPRVEPIAGIGSVARFRRLRTLLRADCIVWGGGTCLFDESRVGMGRLLRFARLCRWLNKPFVLLNIGVEPFKNDEAKRLAAKILAFATVASFRDRHSLDMANALAPAASKYALGGDMALLLPPRPPRGRVRRRIQRVGFSGTHDGDKCASWISATRRTLRSIVERGGHIVFLPLQQGARSDHRFHRLLADDLPPGTYTLASYETPEQCLDILAGLDFLIGERLHSVVLADVAGTPNVGIAIHPKVRYYLEAQRAGHRCFGPETPITPEDLQGVATRYVQPRDFMNEQRALALRAIRAVFAM
jgi:polysaccharide pyruvyl transferase WcaK-like protein